MKQLASFRNAVSPGIAAPQTLQQVDVKEILMQVREYRSTAQPCCEYHKLHFASFPAEIATRAVLSRAGRGAA